MPFLSRCEHTLIQGCKARDGSFAFEVNKSMNVEVVFSTERPHWILLQPSKTFSPIDVTLLGILIYCKCLQDLNAASWIVVTEYGIKTTSSEITSSRALFLIVVRLSGNEKYLTPEAGGSTINSVLSALNNALFQMVKLGLEFWMTLNFLHPLKTPTSNCSRTEPAGMLKDLIWPQFWKAYRPTILTLCGSVIDASAVFTNEYENGKYTSDKFLAGGNLENQNIVLTDRFVGMTDGRGAVEASNMWMSGWTL